MTKAKKIIIGALLGVVTLGGLISYAAPGGHFCNMGGASEKKAEFIVNRISAKLDLNDLQKQNLVALKDAIQEQRKIHQQNNPREELMALLSKPVLDETKVLAMLEERTTRFHLAAPSMINAIANFTNSLDQAQRDQIIKLADKFAKHRGFARRFGGHQQGADKSE